jgi:tetratricopeptide (TPR) repeat protein
MLLFSCSQEKNTFVSKNFHNTTAHYNAYFLAREKMKEIDAQIIKSNADDYTRILPVYPEITEGTRNSIKNNLEEVIKKASLINEKHKNSKWLDDSYVIIGKSYYYKHEYKAALAFFKYVNSKSEDTDARHAALILLMRTYTDSADYMSAKAVSDYLEKKESEGEVFSPDNSRDFHLVKGYYHQKLREYDKMLPELKKALPNIKDKDQRSRINFILGQLNQMNQSDTSAYVHYKASTKRNPPYDLLFHARLYMTQVASGARPDNYKKMERYFRQLLADKKNAEYKDKIWFEMGNYELKRGNTKKAISCYEKSVLEGGKNIPQKALGYLRLGEVYYDQESYEQSKFYYDSAVAIWDQKDPKFRTISSRQKILAEFSAYKNTVQREDSLQKLSKLPKEQIDKIIDDVIALEKEKERIEKARKTSKKEDPFPDPNEISNNPNSTFALVNPQLIEQGKKDFYKIWGTRKLEDNWRRAQKERVDFIEDAGGDIFFDNTTKEENKEEKKETMINKEKYYKDIPFTREQLDTSHKRIEKSLYNIGKIYNQKLEEPEKSIKTFEDLLKRYPSTQYKAEVYYFIYLICENKISNRNKGEIYKKKLFDEFPNSLYTKLLKNPNYLKDNKEANSLAHAKYKEAYDLYKAGKYKTCDSMITAIKNDFSDNDIEDKLALLRILITGQTTNAYLYKFQLQEFISQYASSALVPKAKELLASADQFMAEKNKKGNLVAATDMKYSPDLNKPHFMVMVIPAASSAIKYQNEFNSFNISYTEVKNLTVNSQNLNDTLQIIVVKGFAEKFPAQLYLNNLKTGKSFYEKNGYSKNPIFIITDHNFQLFVDSKMIDSYLKFYKENY